MPDWRKAVANINLVDISHRNTAQLWQNVKRQRAEPATCLPVALQFRLSGLEGIKRHVLQQVQIAGSFAPFPLPLLDRIKPCPDLGAGSFGKGTGFGQ